MAHLISGIDKVRLEQKDFDRISKYVTRHYGIKLPPEKQIMVEGRLQKRIKAIGQTSFRQYLEHVFSEEGQFELIKMVDAISTNKTDFFREPPHFDFLTQKYLPTKADELKGQPLNIWSAAASTGEEIYTLAIVIEEFNRTSSKPRINYFIHGTDISSEALQHALSAIYKEDRIQPIPNEMKKRYFLRSRDRSKTLVRVIPELRKKVKFSRLNLMDTAYKMDRKFDLVFCRNVLIYFDKFNQEAVINKLSAHLKEDGYFFLGHSESIIGKHVPLRQVQPTIYKKI